MWKSGRVPAALGVPDSGRRRHSALRRTSLRWQLLQYAAEVSKPAVQYVQLQVLAGPIGRIERDEDGACLDECHRSMLSR